MKWLKKIQEEPEWVRKTIFWIIVVLLAISFFYLWLIRLESQLAGFRKNESFQDLRIIQLKKQLESLPKLELPKIDLDQLKETE